MVNDADLKVPFIFDGVEDVFFSNKTKQQKQVQEDILECNDVEDCMCQPEAHGR